MIFKPSSLHKLFFTYICPRFYGGAPATPSNTTTTSTVNQSPWQNPVYQALMLGTKDKPGPITSMLRSSAEQTAAYNDMLKGGYSPVPLNQKYDIPKPPTQVPYSRDIPGAEATPAYTLPATATATAPPPGANAIVNGGAKGGIMSLQGYAQGKTAKVVPTIVEKAQTALDSGKKLTPLQTTILQTAADNSAKGGLGTVTVKGNKVTIDPPKRLPNQSSADYEKSLQTFKTAGYDLSPALAKLYPNIKSAAEQKAATSLQNTIGTSIEAPTAFFDPATGMSTLPDFLALQEKARNLGMPSQFGEASDAVKASIKGLMEKANYTPKEIDAALMKAPANVSAEDYVAAQAQTNQMAGPKSWIDQGTAAQYMSPYMQNVVDIQKREANRDYAKQLQELNKQATAAGAFGGSRQAIERSEAARNQAIKLADIQAQGQQQAYTSGMGQFTNEQGQQLQAGQANLGAAQQSTLANQAATNQQRSQYVQQALDAAKLNYGGQLTAEQANQAAQNATNQFNVQSGLQANAQNITALSAAGQQGQGLAGIGTQQNQAALANLGAQGQVAQAEQALAQQGLNNQQQTAQNSLDFTNKANAGVVAGVNSQPVQGGTTVGTATAAPASPFGSARGGLVRNGKVVKRGKK